MPQGHAFNLDEDHKKTISNGENLLETENSGHTLSPPAHPVQMHGEKDHNHNHDDHDHEHDHDISGAPTGDNENGRNGEYVPGEKDDQIDKKIDDNDVGFFERMKKMIFMARSYGPIDMTSSTGTGGFRASYNPRTRQLNISTICKADFHSPLIMDPNGSGNIVVNPTGSANADGRMAVIARTANGLPDADKQAVLASYTWTAQEITDGLASLNTQLDVAENIWGGQHSFFVDKDGWRDVRAQVDVNINATLGTAVDGTDHLQIRSVKTPPSGPDLGAFVRSRGNVQNRANLMFLDDDNLTGVNDNNFLHQVVQFDHDSDVLSRNSKATLDMLIARHKDDNTQLRADGNAANDNIDNQILNKFRLVGHCSSDGSSSYNEKLAAKRIKAVSDYLKAGGLDQAASRIESDNKGEDGATEDAEWRRVDIYIGSGEAQHTIAHEMGHVFGLKDEYAINPGGGLGGTGRPTGTVTGHDGLATQIGAPNATSENTDSIMAMGNEVRGQQYGTFGEALRNLTNIQEWRLIQ